MKKEAKRVYSILIGILAIFEIILLYEGRNELAYYNFILIAVFILVYVLSKKYTVPKTYLIGLIAVGLLNLLGGIIVIDGVRLYDYWWGFLKLDMLIHFVAVLFGTLILYYIIQHSLKLRKKNWAIFFAFMGAMGFGAIFELLELIGVVFLKNQGVGDYMNNALDLFFNFLGAIFASIILLFRKRH